MNDFDKFWAAYPRRVGKGSARRIWEKLQPDEKLCEKMLTTLMAAKLCSQWQNVNYIPHPTTWLSREGWDDEYDTGDVASKPIQDMSDNELISLAAQMGVSTYNKQRHELMRDLQVRH